MFTPLDSQALFSTVFLEGPISWAVWTAILASADPDGNTTLSPKHLSVLWNMPEAEVQKAWDNHTKPDPSSKNPEFEGRRMIKTPDNKWHIVSFKKYRDAHSKDYRTTQIRAAKQRQRAKTKGINVDCEKCGSWVANPGDKVCTACAFREEA
jgi:hypothetical protein